MAVRPSSSRPDPSASPAPAAPVPAAGANGHSPQLVPQGRHTGKPAMTINRVFTLIGSRTRAHLHLVSDTVSKSHACIISTDDGFYVRDLASRTHVYVNGRAVTEADLRNGDLLAIGSFKFKFVDPSRTGSGGAAPRAGAAALAVEGSTDPLALRERVTLIGRRPTCDVSLLESSVSTVHALIFEMNGKRYIRDLGSRTGTFVNETLAHQQVLESADRLRIGETEFRYLSGKAADTVDSLEELEDLVGTGPLDFGESPAGVDAAAEGGITAPAPVGEILAANADLGALDFDFADETPIPVHAPGRGFLASPGAPPATAAPTEASAADDDADIIPLAADDTAPAAHRPQSAENVLPAALDAGDLIPLEDEIDLDGPEDTVSLPPAVIRHVAPPTLSPLVAEEGLEADALDEVSPLAESVELATPSGQPASTALDDVLAADPMATTDAIFPLSGGAASEPASLDADDFALEPEFLEFLPDTDDDTALTTPSSLPLSAIEAPTPAVQDEAFAPAPAPAEPPAPTPSHVEPATPGTAFDFEAEFPDDPTGADLGRPAEVAHASSALPDDLDLDRLFSESDDADLALDLALSPAPSAVPADIPHPAPAAPIDEESFTAGAPAHSEPLEAPLAGTDFGFTLDGLDSGVASPIDVDSFPDGTLSATTPPPALHVMEAHGALSAAGEVTPLLEEPFPSAEVLGPTLDQPIPAFESSVELGGKSDALYPDELHVSGHPEIGGNETPQLDDLTHLFDEVAELGPLNSEFGEVDSAEPIPLDANLTATSALLDLELTPQLGEVTAPSLETETGSIVFAFPDAGEPADAVSEAADGLTSTQISPLDLGVSVSPPLELIAEITPAVSEMGASASVDLSDEFATAEPADLAPSSEEDRALPADMTGAAPADVETLQGALESPLAQEWSLEGDDLLADEIAEPADEPDTKWPSDEALDEATPGVAEVPAVADDPSDIGLDFLEEPALPLPLAEHPPVPATESAPPPAASVQPVPEAAPQRRRFWLFGRGNAPDAPAAPVVGPPPAEDPVEAHPIPAASLGDMPIASATTPSDAAFEQALDDLDDLPPAPPANLDPLAQVEEDAGPAIVAGAPAPETATVSDDGGIDFDEAATPDIGVAATSETTRDAAFDAMLDDFDLDEGEGNFSATSTAQPLHATFDFDADEVAGATLSQSATPVEPLDLESDATTWLEPGEGEFESDPPTTTAAAPENVAVEPLAPVAPSTPADVALELPDDLFDELTETDFADLGMPPAASASSAVTETVEVLSPEPTDAVDADLDFDLPPEDVLPSFDPPALHAPAFDPPAVSAEAESEAPPAESATAPTLPEEGEPPAPGDNLPMISVQREPAAPDPVPAAPAAPASRFDAFFGMGRDQASFIGGMPLPLPPVRKRPVMPFSQQPVTYEALSRPERSPDAPIHSDTRFSTNEQAIGFESDRPSLTPGTSAAKVPELPAPPADPIAPAGLDAPAPADPELESLDDFAALEDESAFAAPPSAAPVGSAEPRGLTEPEASAESLEDLLLAPETSDEHAALAEFLDLDDPEFSESASVPPISAIEPEPMGDRSFDDLAFLEEASELPSNTEPAASNGMPEEEEAFDFQNAVNIAGIDREEPPAPTGEAVPAHGFTGSAVAQPLAEEPTVTFSQWMDQAPLAESPAGASTVDAGAVEATDDSNFDDGVLADLERGEALSDHGGESESSAVGLIFEDETPADLRSAPAEAFNEAPPPMTITPVAPVVPPAPTAEAPNAKPAPADRDSSAAARGGVPAAPRRPVRRPAPGERAPAAQRPTLRQPFGPDPDALSGDAPPGPRQGDVFSQPVSGPGGEPFIPPSPATRKSPAGLPKLSSPLAKSNGSAKPGPAASPAGKLSTGRPVPAKAPTGVIPRPGQKPSAGKSIPPKAGAPRPPAGKPAIARPLNRSADGKPAIPPTRSGVTGAKKSLGVGRPPGTAPRRLASARPPGGANGLPSDDAVEIPPAFGAPATARAESAALLAAPGAAKAGGGFWDRNKMRILLVVLVLLLAAAVAVIAVLLLAPRANLRGMLHFSNLASLPESERAAFRKQQSDLLLDPEVRARARQTLGSAATPGFLADGDVKTIAFADFAGVADFQSSPDAMILTRLSTEPAEDQRRMQALLQAMYDLNLARIGRRAQLTQALADATVGVAALDEQIRKQEAELSTAKQSVGALADLRNEAEKLKPRLDQLARDRSMSRERVTLLENELKRLQDAPAELPPGLAPTTAPSTTRPAPVAADPELLRMGAEYQRLTQNLDAVKAAREAQAAQAKAALDAAQTQFDAQVNSARTAAGNNATLGKYLADLKRLQDMVRSLNDELVQQQKEHRELVDGLKRSLAEADSVRVKQARENDPALKDLQQRYSVVEHRYNVAAAANLPEAADLKAELASLVMRLDSLRGLIAMKDAYSPAVKQFQDVIAKSVKLMEQSRSRNEARLKEVFDQIAKVKPPEDLLPADQKATAQLLDRDAQSLAAARERYNKAVEDANTTADALAQGLEQQAAALKLRIIATAKAARDDQVARQQTSVDAARRAEAEANANFSTAEAAWQAADAKVRGASTDDTRHLQIAAALEPLRQEKASREEGMAAAAKRLQDLVEPESPGPDAVTLTAGEDHRPLYVGSALLGGLAMSLVVLGVTRPPASAGMDSPATIAAPEALAEDEPAAEAWEEPLSELPANPRNTPPLRRRPQPSPV